MHDVFEKIIEKLESEAERWEDSGKEYEDRCEIAVARGIKNAIEIVKQEAEQYNNGWIPCSERLPEGKQRCLTTAKIYFVPDHVDEEDNYIGVAIDTYFEKFGWSSNPEVIAWQPLPKPFQPKGE